MNPGSKLSYDDSQFRDLNDYPSENTLTVNLTHQQLNRLNPPFGRLVAISPSRYEEGANTSSNKPDGYDIKLETAKEIVFQHKSPDNTVVRDGKQWLNYKIDMDQLRILFHRYNPREAFYALPATPQHKQIQEGLDRTIFVDICAVYAKYLEQGEEVSRIYVEYCPGSSTIPDVKTKFNTTKREMDGYPYRDLRSSNRIYEEAITWKPIEKKLKSCKLGLPIRGIPPETYPYYESDRSLPGFANQQLEQFNPAYREHLKNSYALDQYAKNEDYREEMLDWLLTSLRIQADIAHQQDWYLDTLNIDLSSDRVLDLIRRDLDSISSKQKAPSNYLNRTRRHILEKGDRSTTISV
ncbi:hypothetical protein [Natronoarchaeum rubrum]|uniref:hypothetical protein n=1 Tax=Natronoarchaeum rubrum TaxID=755311 RepID=UPI0021122332|nr:hypothetical protein [Natronoarchaeum rubrum]